MNRVRCGILQPFGVTCNRDAHHDGPCACDEEEAAAAIRRSLSKKICGMVSLSGPNQEPLACGYAVGHQGAHAWSTLPTFAASEQAREQAETERDALAAEKARDEEYLRDMLRKVDEQQKGIAVCSWCALPTNSDEDSKRKHQLECPKSPLVARLAAAEKVVEAYRHLDEVIEAGFASPERPDIVRAEVNRAVREYDAARAGEGK